jgi:hypothetical protein
MPPLAIITGILMGSSAAIAASLSVVALMFFLLRDDYPRLDSEFGPLLTSTGIFLLMTVVCALGFVSLIKRHPLRWWGQGAMWVALVAVIFYYLPA